MKTSTHKYILKIVIIGIFAAVAYVLSIFPKFNIFPAAPWLDVDFSDAPALLVSFALDPISGFLVVLIKSILHLTISHTGHVGLIANILNGGSLVLVAGAVKLLAYRAGLKRSSSLIGAIAATPIQIACAIIANLYVLLPAYGIDLVSMFGSTSAYVYIVVGHNAIKDALACAISVLLYMSLSKQIVRLLGDAR